MARIRHSAEQIINKLREAEELIERWRTHYSTKRPHSSHGHRSPAPQTIALGA